MDEDTARRALEAQKQAEIEAMYKYESKRERNYRLMMEQLETSVF